ncbi:Transcription factor spt8 [Gonapodya sp. JEL0774]|nr:Transcription factor spt8 [Gonapodya sp. JEL0774]
MDPPATQTSKNELANGVPSGTGLGAGDNHMDLNLDDETEKEIDGYVMQDKFDPMDAVISHDCKSYEFYPQVAAIHPTDVHSVAATQNMRWLFTASHDGEIRMFDFFASMNGRNPLPQNQRSGFSDPVTKAGVLWSSWPLEEQVGPGEIPDSLSHPIKISPCFAIDVHSEAHYMLAGCASGAVNLYSVRHEEGVCQYVLRSHKAPVSCIKIAPGETSCFTGSWDKSLLYWDLNTGNVLSSFGPQNSYLTSLSFQPGASSPRLLSTTVDGLMYLWDTRATSADPSSPVDGATPRGLVRRFAVPERTPPWCMSACWSPDGGKVYVGRRNGTVDEFDVAEGTRVRAIEMPKGSGRVTVVEAMGNGRQIICTSQDNIRLYNLYDDEKDPPSSPVTAPLSEPDPLFNPPTVPFAIVPGHRGGAPVSRLLLDSANRYMVTATGHRGWDGMGSGGGVVVCYEVDAVK